MRRIARVERERKLIAELAGRPFSLRRAVREVNGGRRGFVGPVGVRACPG
jgi:hypothetical protein